MLGFNQISQKSKILFWFLYVSIQHIGWCRCAQAAYDTWEPANGNLGRHLQINAKGCQSFYLGAWALNTHSSICWDSGFISGSPNSPPSHPVFQTRAARAMSQWPFLLDTNEMWPWAREDFPPEPPDGYFGGGKLQWKQRTREEDTLDSASALPAGSPGHWTWIQADCGHLLAAVVTNSVSLRPWTQPYWGGVSCMWRGLRTDYLPRDGQQIQRLCW